MFVLKIHSIDFNKIIKLVLKILYFYRFKENIQVCIENDQFFQFKEIVIFLNFLLIGLKKK